jgi:hypothetical protein
MHDTELIDRLNKSIKADTRELTVISPYTKPEGLFNELVFFIKPEVTTAGPDAVREVLTLSLEQFKRHAIRISGISLIGNEYLKKFNLIEEHYGVINLVAKKGHKVLTKAPRRKFKESFGAEIESVHVLGGFEFLVRYPDYTVNTLNDLWESGQRVKLGAGIYCEKHEIKGETVYILNGFNPFQLAFFTDPGRYIIVFSLYTETDWSVLRNEMIGVTNPYNADKRSLRARILSIKDKIGVEINPGKNGVHLSAGPVEALSETIRFCSVFPDKKLDIHAVYTGARLLREGFTEEGVKRCMANELIPYNGEKRYVFDLTEEKNLGELAFLKDRINE